MLNTFGVQTDSSTRWAQIEICAPSKANMLYPRATGSHSRFTHPPDAAPAFSPHPRP